MLCILMNNKDSLDLMFRNGASKESRVLSAPLTTRSVWFLHGIFLLFPSFLGAQRPQSDSLLGTGNYSFRFLLTTARNKSNFYFCPHTLFSAGCYHFLVLILCHIC